MLTADKIQVYARDFMEFAADVEIPAKGRSVRFGDAWAPFQVERFQTLAPSLLAVTRGHKPPIGRFWIEATKGGSKDSDVTIAFLFLLMFARSPIAIEIGAGKKDQAAEPIDIARGLLRLNPLLGHRIKIKPGAIVCEKTHSTCKILPSDAETSHGSRPTVVLVNELSHVARADFLHVLLDNLAKVPGGLGIIATNAGRLDSWQHHLRQTVLNSTRWHFHKFDQTPPWIDPADVEEARLREPPWRFARYYQGLWTAEEGNAIPPEQIRRATTLDGPTLWPEPGWIYGGGLDLGAKHDRSAFVLLGVLPGSGKVRVCGAWSWAPPRAGGQVNLQRVVDHIVDVDSRFRLSLVTYDPWQAILAAEQLQREGVPMAAVPFVGQNLNAMARDMLNAFADGRLELYDDPDLIRDLGKLSIVERGFGLKLQAPSDGTGHADTAFALAVGLGPALATATEPPAPPAGPFTDFVSRRVFA